MVTITETAIRPYQFNWLAEQDGLIICTTYAAALRYVAEATETNELRVADC